MHGIPLSLALMMIRGPGDLSSLGGWASVPRTQTNCSSWVILTNSIPESVFFREIPCKYFDAAINLIGKGRERWKL